MCFEEALKRLLEEFNLPTIKVETFILSDNIQEGLPTGSLEDTYDDQTVEEWYSFVASVERLVDNISRVVNISISKHPNSLTEYIDFYKYDEAGNEKEGLLVLRISDHSSTTNARNIQKKKASRLDTNYRLLAVVVNSKKFDSYEEALVYILNLLKGL